MLIEKLMSGLWMGDNARRILLTFARKTQLFGSKARPRAAASRLEPPCHGCCLHPVRAGASKQLPRVCSLPRLQRLQGADSQTHSHKPAGASQAGGP
jgi:hypothetical protein